MPSTVSSSDLPFSSPLAMVRTAARPKGAPRGVRRPGGECSGLRPEQLALGVLEASLPAGKLNRRQRATVARRQQLLRSWLQYRGICRMSGRNSGPATSDWLAANPSISRPTLYRWWAKVLTKGVLGLVDGRSMPTGRFCRPIAKAAWDRLQALCGRGLSVAAAWRIVTPEALQRGGTWLSLRSAQQRIAAEQSPGNKRHKARRQTA